MRTTKSCKDSKGFWTKSWNKFILAVVVVALCFLRTLFATERINELSSSIGKKPTLKINDRTVFTVSNRDTIRLTIKSYSVDTVLIKEETNIVDTLTRKEK